MSHSIRPVARCCLLCLMAFAILGGIVGCGSSPMPEAPVIEIVEEPAVSDPREPLLPELTPDEAEPEQALSQQEIQRAYLSRVFGTLYDRVSANGLQQLPEHTRDLYVVQYFRQEFELGGLEYYFYNTASDHAVETVDALREMNAPEAADALQAAFEVFPDGQPSRDVSQRQDVLDGLSTDQQEVLSKLHAQLTPLVSHLPSHESDFIRHRGIKFDFRN